MFFERLRCSTRRADDHRQEHTGSDPGSQCLRSWLDQDSRGCRSERLDRFRIRPKESSFRPQLAFVATGDGPRRHAPRARTTPRSHCNSLEVVEPRRTRAFENGGSDSLASFEPVGPEVSAPTRASGRGPWLPVSIAPVPGSLPWRLGFRPVQAILERNHALTSTDSMLQRASPRTPAPHRRGGAFSRLDGEWTGLQDFRRIDGSHQCR